MMTHLESVHSSTGNGPNPMILERNTTLPLEAVVGKPPHPTYDDVEPDEYIEKLQKTLRDVHDLARKNLEKNADYN